MGERGIKKRKENQRGGEKGGEGVREKMRDVY